jgi:hypothetical protein
VDSVRCDAGARFDGHAAGQLELERGAVAGDRAHEFHADEDFSAEPCGLRMDSAASSDPLTPLASPG